MQDASEEFDYGHAAVLSLDVVGYARLMAKAPEQTLRALRQLKTLIRISVDHFQGRLFSEAGDGFLVEFEVPLGAVRCALDIQTRLREAEIIVANKLIWLRAGVDCGEVILADEGLHGDCVNRAVRLQEACPSGGLLISQMVRSQIKDDIEERLNSIDFISPKHMPESVPAFEVEVPGADIMGQGEELTQVALSGPVSGFKGRSALAILPLEIEWEDQDFMVAAEGFTDSLILAISHMRQIPVIDRHSSSSYREKALSPFEVGQKLGARYVVTGSLSKQSTHICLSLRLMDVANEHTVWTENYKFQNKDVFRQLYEMRHMVAATLAGRLEAAEEVRARSARISRIDIVSLVWRARWHLNRLTQEDAQTAYQYLERALEQNPRDPEALIQLGFWHWIKCWTQRSSKEDMETFKAHAQRAMAVAPFDSRGHFLIGSAEILLAEPAKALAHLLEAIQLNPSFAHAHAQIGSCHMLMGTAAQAVESLEMSIRLNSKDYYLFVSYGELACSHCMNGDWETAIAYARRSLRLRPYYWHARMTEITALSELGEDHEATRAIAALVARRPDFFQRNYIDWLPFADKRWNKYFKSKVVSAHAKWDAKSSRLT